MATHGKIFQNFLDKVFAHLVPHVQKLSPNCSSSLTIFAASDKIPIHSQASLVGLTWDATSRDFKFDDKVQFSFETNTPSTCEKKYSVAFTFIYPHDNHVYDFAS